MMEEKKKEYKNAFNAQEQLNSIPFMYTCMQRIFCGFYSGLAYGNWDYYVILLLYYI